MDGIGSKPGQPSGSFFTPLSISMTGILITSLALVAYHFFIVRYCMRQRLRSNTSAVSQTVPDQQFTNRVEEKILITIPILSYSSTKNDGNAFLLDQTECVICLGDLQDGDMVRLLPNCRHSFHVSCIDNWFQRHCSCPICRSPMVKPSSTNPSVALPVNVSDNRNEVAQRQDGETSLTSAGEVSVTSSGIESSTGLLGDSVSTVLSMGGKPQFWAAAALKRSLSMNQYYDLVNLERVSRKEESSSSSSSRNILMESRSFRAQSMKQLDRMSSRLVGSFSQLKVSRSGSTTNQILPY